jgi:hypothetical protein
MANTTMGLCIEEALQPFRLGVSGNSGCTNRVIISVTPAESLADLIGPVEPIEFEDIAADMLGTFSRCYAAPGAR